MSLLKHKNLMNKEWIYHVPFWLGWVVIMNAGESNGFGYYNQKNHDLLLPLIISTSFNILYFYGNALWLAPRYLDRKKVGAYIGALLVFSAIFILAKTGAEKLYINSSIPDLADVPFSALIKENLYSLPFFGLTSYLFWRYLKNKREKEWLTQEKLKQELALVKAQISPHFLFNALNNLYSLGLQGNQERVNEGILKLSDLLRYMIYDNQLDRIALQKELSYIGDFVEINKLMMRQEELDKVVCRVEGSSKDLKIAPMLLVTFVENAFKHGTSQNGETDIRISAEIIGNELSFRVVNKVNQKGSENDSKKDQGGLGLKNARRILDALYKNKHKLLIQEEKGYFDVALKIELKP